MEGFWLDTRLALRSLMLNRRFTVAALLTIILTVAGITTIFTLVNSVLLRPLPYPNPDRLVKIKEISPKGLPQTFSVADYLDFKSRSQSFESIAVYTLGYGSTLDRDTDPLAVQTNEVTPEIFPLLGIRMALGRPLLPEDTKAESPKVAVISYDLWQNRFGGTPDALGKTLQVAFISSYTIVGVLPRGLELPLNWQTTAAVWNALQEPYDTGRRYGRYTVVAKLRPGVSVEAANREVAHIAGGIAAEHPDTNQGRSAAAALILDETVGDVSLVLWIFFGAVSCVLLIGIANLISLQIVRNSAREREICIRAALGAGRWRLIRQLLLETLVLSLCGGIIGMIAAWAGIQAMITVLPKNFPRTEQIGIDGHVLIFAFGVSLLVGIVFGIVPAWRASRPDLNAGMNDGSRAATAGTHRTRTQRVLIALETAVALVLLIGATLLANSFVRLISQDAGIKEDNLWLVNVDLPLRYRDKPEQVAFWNSAIEGVRTLSETQSAAITVNTPAPLSGGDIQFGGILPEGATDRDHKGISVSLKKVGEGYFSTLGIPILKGRPILESDKGGAERVAVVNELAANILWPGEDPIGKRLTPGKDLITVVGIIPTFKHRQLDGDLFPQVYTSYLQESYVGGQSVIMLRAKPGISGIAAAAQSVISKMEKDAKVDVLTMAQERWNLLALQRFRTGILMIFAAGALFLALVGIFGVVSYSVVQRQREIGVRVALGATAGNVVSLMLRQALIPMLFGLAAGIAASVASTKLLSTFLFQIQATDLGTFAAAVALLGVAATVAGWIPARRAMKVDPMSALRHD